MDISKFGLVSCSRDSAPMPHGSALCPAAGGNVLSPVSVRWQRPQRFQDSQVCGVCTEVGMAHRSELNPFVIYFRLPFYRRRAVVASSLSFGGGGLNAPPNMRDWPFRSRPLESLSLGR